MDIQKSWNNHIQKCLNTEWWVLLNWMNTSTHHDWNHILLNLTCCLAYITSWEPLLKLQTLLSISTKLVTVHLLYRYYCHHYCIALWEVNVTAVSNACTQWYKTWNWYAFSVCWFPSKLTKKLQSLTYCFNSVLTWSFTCPITNTLQPDKRGEFSVFVESLLGCSCPHFYFRSGTFSIQ